MSLKKKNIFFVLYNNHILHFLPLNSLKWYAKAYEEVQAVAQLLGINIDNFNIPLILICIFNPWFEPRLYIDLKHSS